jgi:CRISPR-associated protein Cpf1
LWIDETLTVNRILKYFITKENKRKGNPQDSEVENLLKSLIYEFDWFKHYDAVRNYLTKKQQNEINKLKLNFKNAALASGWDINKETDNFCVVLQDEAKNNYLAILRNENKTLFEKILVEGRGKNQKITENELYISNNSGRKKMNYKQIAAPTGIG